MTMTDTLTVEVQTQARGAVPKGAVRLAVHRVDSLLRKAPEPVLFARVTLTMSADPAVRCPAVAEVNVDLNGQLIHAQAAGETMHEAVEHAGDRLRIRLERSARHWEALRGGRPANRTGEWRHTTPPAQRPSYLPRPVGQRKVARHKSYTLGRKTLDEAAAEAGLLGYDFHLFTEKSTGQDSVICRTPDGYRVALAHPRTGALGPVDPSIAVSLMPAPRLVVTQAATWLETAGQPFLFFVNAETGRGNVIYHRYDGDYGLVVPADDETS
jgi:ribosome-associated translation inhibitor RaiA